MVLSLETPWFLYALPGGPDGSKLPVDSMHETSEISTALVSNFLRYDGMTAIAIAIVCEQVIKFTNMSDTSPRMSQS